MNTNTLKKPETVFNPTVPLNLNISNRNQITDATLRSIAEIIPLGELFELCRSSPDYFRICENSNFWKDRINTDYGIETQFNVHTPFSWKDFLENIYKDKIYVYDVTFNNQKLGSSYWILDVLTFDNSITLFLNTKNIPIQSLNGIMVQYDSNDMILKSRSFGLNDPKFNFEYQYDSLKKDVNKETRKLSIITDNILKNEILTSIA